MKLKITIPTELKDIKLSQFQKYLKVTDGIEEEHEKHRLMVGIFCNLSDKQVGSIPAKEFPSIVKTITETLNQKAELIPTFKHEGKEYGFIPNIEDITLDEKADIDTFMQDWQKMDKMMGVCYRPINYKHKDTYLIDDYMQDINVAEKNLLKAKRTNNKDVTLDVAMGAVVFFYNLMKDLLNYIPNYIEREVEQNPKVLQNLAENGIGIKTFTQSLEETFSTLKELANLDYIKH